MKLPKEGEAILVIKDYITDGIDLTKSGSATRINIQKTGSLPGQVEPDVLSMLQFLPGVNSPTAKASDLYVRGCTPDQNLITWEDIPIYHSAHYFGMLTAFNPYTIQSMDVYRGGFDADYGGRVASIIKMEAPNESNRDSYRGVGTNMTHAFVHLHQVFNSEKPAALNISLRRSFQELWESPTFKNISKVNQQGFIIGNKELAELPENIKINNDFFFLDAQLKFSKRFNDKTRLEISALAAQNDFQDVIEDSGAGSIQMDMFDLRNLGASAKLFKDWNDQLSSTFKLIGITYEYDYDYTLMDSEQMNVRVFGQKQNRITDAQFFWRNDYKLSESSNLKFGYHFTQYEIDFTVIEKSPTQNADVNDSDSDDSQLHVLFASWEKTIRDRLSMSIGIRSSYYERSKDLYWEPRFNLSYKINDDLFFRTNVGLYTQYIGQVTEFRGSDSGFSLPLWAQAENMSIPVLESGIAQAGLIYKKNGLTIDVQGYYRQTTGMSSRAYSFVLEDSSTKPENGNADILGVDVLLKKRFGNLRSWLSYAYGQVNFDFNRISNRDFPSDYDQRHVFQWANQYKYGQHYFGLGIKYASGLPYSRLTDFEVTSGPNQPFTYRGDYDGINNNRLSGTQELNISYEYAINHWDNFRAYLNLSIRNLLNRENIFERTYTVRNNGVPQPQIVFNDKANLFITPNLSFRLEW